MISARFLHLRSLAVALVSFALAGCGGQDSPPGMDPASGAGDPETPSPDRDGSVAPAEAGEAASDAGLDVATGTCNSLADLASAVPIDAVAADTPPALGGAVIDGTYVTTSATRYTGPGGSTGPTGQTTKITLRIAGDHAETMLQGVARSAIFSVAGTLITTTGTCPSHVVSTVGYTATGTSFTIFIPETSGTLVTTFTRL